MAAREIKPSRRICMPSPATETTVDALPGSASTVVAVDGDRVHVVREGLVPHAIIDAALAEASRAG